MFTIDSLYHLESNCHLFKSFLYVTLVKSTLAFLLAGVALSIITIAIDIINLDLISLNDDLGFILFIVGIALVFLDYVLRGLHTIALPSRCGPAQLVLCAGCVMRSCFHHIRGILFPANGFFLLALPVSLMGVFIGAIGIIVIL